MNLDEMTKAFDEAMATLNEINSQIKSFNETVKVA